MWSIRSFAVFAFIAGTAFSVAQPMPGRVCKAVSERTGDIGCWILSNQPIGEVSKPEVFWQLDVYPTRAAAESAKTPTSTVVESLGKTWLLTIGDAGWNPSGGKRIAEIGPLPVVAGEKLLSRIHGGNFYSGHGSTVAYPLRPRGLVHGSWRDLSGDA